MVLWANPPAMMSGTYCKLFLKNIASFERRHVCCIYWYRAFLDQPFNFITTCLQGFVFAGCVRSIPVFRLLDSSVAFVKEVKRHCFPIHLWLPSVALFTVDGHLSELEEQMRISFLPQLVQKGLKACKSQTFCSSDLFCVPSGFAMLTSYCLQCPFCKDHHSWPLWNCCIVGSQDFSAWTFL